jgi:hypothetical protein
VDHAGVRGQGLDDFGAIERAIGGHVRHQFTMMSCAVSTKNVGARAGRRHSKGVTDSERLKAAKRHDCELENGLGSLTNGRGQFDARDEMADDCLRRYDGFVLLSLSEEMAMTSRPSIPDSLPMHALEGEDTELPSSAAGPSKASDRRVVERTQADVEPRAAQPWRQISDEEWRARHEEYKRRLAEIDAEDDTPEEVYDQFMRNIDEERRRQGRPPAFEGYY